MDDLSTDPPLFMSYDDDLYYFVNVVNYLGKLHVFWYIRKKRNNTDLLQTIKYSTLYVDLFLACDGTNVMNLYSDE